MIVNKIILISFILILINKANYCCTFFNSTDWCEISIRGRVFLHNVHMCIQWVVDEQHSANQGFSDIQTN